MFGLRIVDGERVVFAYRMKNYTDPKRHESMHVIKITKDIGKAFEFLGMDYEDYKKQQFQTIFEFTEYVTSHLSKYLTVDIVANLEKEVEETIPSERTETHELVYKFVSSLKVGHFVLQGFAYVPLLLYSNLREKTVRSFFDYPEVTEQFVALKLEHMREKGLQGKFSPLKVVTWIRPLRYDSELTGLFTISFVNYKTNNKPNLFPRYLIDKDPSVIKRDVVNYYCFDFQKSKVYIEYLKKSIEKDGTN